MIINKPLTITVYDNSAFGKQSIFIVHTVSSMQLIEEVFVRFELPDRVIGEEIARDIATLVNKKLKLVS